MNIWRLIPYHVKDRAAELAEWSRRNETIAIGWGGTDDLGKQRFSSEAEMKRIVADAHPDFVPNSKVNGGKSLWRFYKEMQIGDLIIISAAGSRKQTMRVTGDYYYAHDDPYHHYEHRRKAEVVPIDANILWHAANKVAPGEGIYTTLVRCDRRLTQADVIALTD